MTGLVPILEQDDMHAHTEKYQYTRPTYMYMLTVMTCDLRWAQPGSTVNECKFIQLM